MLGGVERGDIYVDKAHVRILKRRFRRRGEIAIAGADAYHQVGIACKAVGGGGAGGADGSHAERMVVAQAAAAGERFAHRNAGLFGESAQRLGRLAVDHAATGDDQRALARADPFCRALQRRPIGTVARNSPDPLRKKRFRVVIRFCLHVLRQAHRHRPGLHRVGQHAHRRRQGSHQLVRSIDAVPVATERLEAVVDGDVLGVL